MKFNIPLFFYFLIFTHSAISSAQTVTPTGSLNSRRVDHCSQLLANGKVVVFGGHNGAALNNVVYASSEIYNPSTQTWSYTGNMNIPRTNFTSVVLNNGNILAMGGWNYEDGFSSCEIYDVAMGTWKFAGSMLRERFLHASIKLKDGRVLVTGSGDAKTDLYDPATDTWRATGETKVIHGFYMAMTLMDDGKVLAIGGDGAPTSAEVYDPATEQWTLLTAATNFNRSSHTITRLNNGTFLIVGTGGVTTEEQLSSEIYNPVTNTFTVTGNLLNNVVDARTVLLDNGNVLLYNFGDPFNPIDTKCVQIYNAASGIWESQVYNFIGTFNVTINKLNNGKILLAGGTYTTGQAASSNCFLVSQDAFSGCTPPNISLEVTGNPGCNGNAATITMPVTENMVSYQAYIGDQPSGNTYVGNGAALSLTIPVTVLSTGRQVIKVKAVKAGCAAYYLTDTAVADILVPAIATPVITASGPTTMCILTGGSVELSAPAGMAVYEWSNGASTQKITMSADGIVKVRVKDSPAGCFTRYSEPVTVAYVMPFLNAGPFESACSSKAPFMLSGFSPAGGTWSGTGVRADGTFDPSVSGPGNFTLTYTFCNRTVTKNMFVIPTPKVPDFTVKADKDTLCSSQVTFLKVLNPVLTPLNGITYQFSSNNVLLYSTDYYTSSTASYRTPYADQPKTYTIKGVMKNSCGADSVMKTYTIYQEVDRGLSVGTKTPVICRNETAFIYIAKSQKNVTYRLLSGNDFIGTPLKGNGDTLFIPTGSLKLSGTFSVYGSTPNCFGTLNQSVQIKVPGPKANFTVESWNVETGTPINVLLNPSNPTGTLYNWSFGSGAEKTSSNLMNPLPVTYNTTGSRTFKLTVTDKDKCVDSMSRQVHVIAPVTVPDCAYTISSGIAPAKPAAVTTDKDDNIFQVFETITDALYSYSYKGDSLYSKYEGIEKYNYIQPLNKYNAKGTLQWSTVIRHNSYQTVPSSNLITDAAGNVYYAFYIHTNDTIRAYSADGTYTSFIPKYEYYVSSVVIIKYDKNGIFQWQNSYYESGQSHIALTLNKQSELYVGSYTRLHKFNAAGTLLWKKEIGYADIKTDSHDNILALRKDGFSLEKIDGQGNTIYTKNWDYSEYTTPLYLEVDEKNNVYLTGQLYARFNFNKDTLLYSNYSSGGNRAKDYFICKINANNQDEWAKQISSNGLVFLKGIDYKNGKLIFAGQTDHYETTFRYNYKGVDSSHKETYSGFYRQLYADSLVINDGGNFICLVDTNQTGVIKMEKAQDNANWLSAYDFLGMNYNIVCLSANAEKIIYADMNASKPLFGQSITLQSALPVFTASNSSVLLISAPTCLFPETTPVSMFTIPGSACAKKTISFMDLSAEYPDSWLWTFEGGTPATSTLRNPVVTFDTPDSHSISLKASNAAGSGTVFSRQIDIDLTPDLKIYSDTACQGGSVVVHASGAATYQWPDHLKPFPVDAYSFYQITKGNQFAVKGLSESGNCYITKKYSIPVNPLPEVDISKPQIDLCRRGSITDLPPATPPGGTYYGIGIVNNQFDPSYVSYGFDDGYTFSIQYKYTDAHGCTNYDYMGARLVPSQPVYFYPDINTLCKDQVLNHPLASPAGGTFTGTGTVNGNFDYTSLAAGQYNITYSYSNNGCSGSATTSIQIVEPQPVYFYPDINTICKNEVLSHPLASPSGGIFTGTGTVNGAFDYTSLAAGQYNITYSYNNNGCTASGSTSIQIVAPQEIYFSPDINALCNDQALSQPIALPAGGTYTGAGTVNGSFDHTALAPGQYNITYSYNDGVCTASSSAVVTIQQCSTTTGIHAGAGSAAANFYPNPCTGSFTINNIPVLGNTYTILLYNTAGQLVKKMETTSGASLTIDVKEIASGLYHFKVLSIDTTLFENNIIIQE